MADERWADLKADREFIKCLDEADAAKESRGVILTTKRGLAKDWSNALADACARMIAEEVRRDRRTSSFNILPMPGGSAEPRTFVARGEEKEIDVVVSSSVSGLQVGFSLKGMNFRDLTSLSYAKNITGRSYELADEVDVVHEYQPAALMVAVFFLPLASVDDKRSKRSWSSFAQTVSKLRSRTMSERVDLKLPIHNKLADMAFVALYVPADIESDSQGSVDYFGCERGVVRYFNVEDDPPRRGRPKISTTLSLKGMVDAVLTKAFPDEDSNIEWADPEV